jgi:hypothetical protein
MFIAHILFGNGLELVCLENSDSRHVWKSNTVCGCEATRRDAGCSLNAMDWLELAGRTGDCYEEHPEERVPSSEDRL